jgi:hypothetical protein
MLRITITLAVSLIASSASAQSNNLVKNPSAESGLQFWRVFGNASVSDCGDAGKCFSLNQDAFIFQDIEVSENTAAMYAVFISFASIEQVNIDKALGQPYLHGYFMTSGELRNATLLANLAGQQMGRQPNENSAWVKQFGVFSVPERTGRIRIFLRSGCGKTQQTDACVSHFRAAGVFLFDTKEVAIAFIASYQ